MEALLGKTLKNSDQTDFETSSLAEPKVICLYFSGSFCGPCKKFTEYLKMFYEEINCDGNNVEVVLIPADDKEKSYIGKSNLEYFETMPWKSLPFADLKIKGFFFF